jgi:hypothetical protein
LYFDDVRIYTDRCLLSARGADIASVDFSPAGVVPGDCVVDELEISTCADGWLARELVVVTKNPGDANLVLYYPLDEGDGNTVTPTAGNGGRAGSLDPWDGTTYNTATQGGASNTATLLSTDHAPLIGGTGCIYFPGTSGTKLQCGTYGQAGLGISNRSDIGDVNSMTVSCWTKWLGHRTFDNYLNTKSQGVVGKRGGWSDSTLMWMYEADTGGGGGGIGLRHYNTGAADYADVYSPANRMLTYVNRWVHVAVTLNGHVADGNNCTIYIDGAGARVWSVKEAAGPIAL